MLLRTPSISTFNVSERLQFVLQRLQCLIPVDVHTAGPKQREPFLLPTTHVTEKQGPFSSLIIIHVQIFTVLDSHQQSDHLSRLSTFPQVSPDPQMSPPTTPLLQQNIRRIDRSEALVRFHMSFQVSLMASPRMGWSI